ncbi:ribosome small subunit-dependent GTPase A [Kangiella sp. HZ709]|uniref:ribosome small subunit-dependent GTPase A n=1 Tax=Kangiella sp. HZ709 TaxID=2666328 RepID=UPI0012B111B6|nr:ribosome small subunit-dependent GTPase A [Kangiella sp. HZ709]MRX27576.1 ribosome small subunit-dependent GTPase A [Kangiella sp. HZ709]
MARRQGKHITDKQHNKKKVSIDESSLLAPEEGVVISRFGQQADIADKDFKIIRCFIRKSLDIPVVGDKVIFCRQAKTDQGQEKGVINELLQRHSLLKRPTPHYGIKPVVANVDFIALLLAPALGFSEMMLDRYLVAAQASELPVWIIFNKWDLLNDNEKQEIEGRLKPYKNLGYPIHIISAKQGSGVDEFISQIGNKSLLLAGQSGVGKSTLINRLFPNNTVATSEISETSGLGTHTTTASRLYRLAKDSYIVDSPGVREFGLWHLDAELIQNGFIEISRISEQCKFRNCRHLNEPKCAVLQAAEDGQIAQSRLNNYQYLIQNFDQVNA